MAAQPPPYAKLPPRAVRRKCRAFVIATAERYDIPPAHITAHVTTVKANAARREVYHYMLSIGLTRSQLALAFNRDLRRVRASVIGVPDPTKRRKRSKPKPGTASAHASLRQPGAFGCSSSLESCVFKSSVSRIDYSRFDLLGDPLPDAPAARRVTLARPLREACEILALLLPDHPLAFAFIQRHSIQSAATPMKITLPPDPFAKLPLVFVLPREAVLRASRMSEIHRQVAALEAEAKQRGLTINKEKLAMSDETRWTISQTPNSIPVRTTSQKPHGDLLMNGAGLSRERGVAAGKVTSRAASRA